MLAVPLQEHTNYDRVNNLLAASAAASVWSKLLRHQRPMELPLRLLSLSELRVFRIDFQEIPLLTNQDLVDLANTLPRTIEELSVGLYNLNNKERIENYAVSAIAQAITRFDKLKILDLSGQVGALP